MMNVDYKQQSLRGCCRFGNNVTLALQHNVELGGLKSTQLQCFSIQPVIHVGLQCYHINYLGVNREITARHKLA